jgi:hypothetical protein
MDAGIRLVAIKLAEGFMGQPWKTLYRKGYSVRRVMFVEVSPHTTTKDTKT